MPPLPLPVRTQPATITIPQWLALYVINNASKPHINGLIQQAKVINPAFDINSLQPFEITSLTQIANIFGDIDTVVLALRRENVLTRAGARNIYDLAKQEQDIIDEAARVAEIPTIPLKYHNMTDRVYGKAKEQIDALKAQRSLPGANLAAINAQIAAVQAKWNTIPLDEYAAKQISDINKERTRISAMTPGIRQRVLLRRLESKERKLEARLIRRKISRHGLFDQTLVQVEETAKRIRNEKEARLPYQKAKLLIDSDNEKQRILDEVERRRSTILVTPPQPAPNLRVIARATTTGGTPLVDPPDALRYAKFIDPVTGEVDRSMFKKRVLTGVRMKRQSAEIIGVARADAYESSLANVKKSIELSVERSLAGISTSTAEYQKVSEDIAGLFAKDLQDKFETALRANKGLIGAQQHVMKYIDRYRNDTTFRTRVAAQIIKSLQESRPTTSLKAAGRVARSWTDACLKGLNSSSNHFVVKNVTYDVRKPIEWQNVFKKGLPIKRPILVRKEVIQFNDGTGHIVEGTTYNAIGPSGANLSRALSGAYMTRRNLEDTARKYDQLVMDGRGARLTNQLAFAQGANAALRLIREDPVAALFQLPLDLAYAYAPQPIKKASITARSAMLGLATAPVLGPFAAGLAFAHQSMLQDLEMQKKYKLPYFHTADWLKMFTEGYTEEALFRFMPLAPLAHYDQKGNLRFGIHLAPATWEVAVDIVGQLFINGYNKDFLDLKNMFGGDNKKAQKAALGNVGMQIKKAVGSRLKDKKKRRDPISIFIFAPAWYITKAIGMAILEKAGILPSLRNAIDGNQFLRAWKYGIGYADELTVLQSEAIEINKLYDDLTLTTAQRNSAISNIQTKFSRLQGIGKVIKGASKVFHFGRLALDVGVRWGGVALISSLLGVTGPAAVAIGGAYAIPWAIDKVMRTPFLGGEVPGMGGPYQAGILKGRFGNFAKLWNIPLNRIWIGSNLSIPQRLGITAGRIFPWNGLWMGLLLSQFNVPPLIAFGVPMFVETSAKIVQELARLDPLVRGLWSGITSSIGTFVQVGTLSLALEHGGFFGLFDVFKKFSLPNLGKLLALPGTYIGFYGLVTTISALTFGLPPTIAAALFTGGVIALDSVLRLAGVEHGLWGAIFEPLWKGILDWIKDRGWGVATGVGSAVLGLFSLVTAALRGDIQGVATSIVLMAIGGIFLTFTAASATSPSSYYTPTGTGGETSIITENTYIKNTDKRFLGIDGSKLNYQYEYYVKLSAMNEISITVKDRFEGIDTSNIITIEPENATSYSETYSSSSTITKEFTVTLSKPLNQIFSSDEEELCNYLTIKIDKIKDNLGVERDPLPNERNVELVECINRRGEVVSPYKELTYLPLDKDKAMITSCYGPRYDGFHHGIDLGASTGTSVYAAGGGKVLISRESYVQGKGLGKFVVIDHENGTTSTYGHLSSVSVIRGEGIKPGQIIGRVGSTGNSSGPHLHFALNQYESFVSWPGTNSYNSCLEKKINICKVYRYSPQYFKEGEECTTTPESSN